MACGLPMVVSSHVATGIKEGRDNEHFLVADSPEEICAKVIYLLRNYKERCRIAKNARELVESKYSWDNSVSLLIDIYYEALKKG